MKIALVLRILALLALAIECCAPVPAQVDNLANSRTITRSADRGAKLSAQAVEALFADSDLQRARRHAEDALASAPTRSAESQRSELDAVFVVMEAAALQADVPAEIEAAVRLCEMRAADGDPRVTIAAARLLDSAGNTTQFRAVVPRIRTVLINRPAQSSYLRAALLSAAKDGLPGLSIPELAHSSGLITDWAVVGPFGKYSNISFDQAWPPEKNGLQSDSYRGHAVERFHFDDGTFELADYLSGPGVLYATANVQVPSAGQYRIRVESSGTLQVLIDRKRVINKDNRLHTTPELTAATVHLAPGHHPVLVKFVPSAAPFRIALFAAGQARLAPVQAISSPLEAAYVSAALDYWNGNYSGAIAQLTRMGREHASAAVDMLLAQAWQHNDETSVEVSVLAQEALKLAPDCLAATSTLVMNAFSQWRFEEAVAGARSILEQRADFEPALHVLAASSAHLEWHADAMEAYDTLVKMRPSCSVLQEASELATSLSDLDHARALESQLATCAPGSLAWAQALSRAGEHLRAAGALNTQVAERPFDRAARRMLVRELALAGKSAEAITAADELARIAPGSRDYRTMRDALRRGGLPDTTTSFQMEGFADARQFYSAYRRDSFTVVNETARRHFSGGPAVVLLNDRVAQLTSDGHVNLYVHKITRVLDRDGLLRYGEVAVPTGASVLALRTIKADGTVAEPELTQHKTTISMPALAPDDAIDLEYVLRYPEGDFDNHTDAFEFTFGSFAAPILFSRFVVMSPADARLRFVPSGSVPSVKVRDEDGQVAREWERDNIVQSVSEVSMPRAGLLPSIRVLPELSDGWAGVRDFYCDALIDAVRIGSRVESAATAITGTTDEQKIRAAYKFVTTRVRQTSPLFDSGVATSGEQTLSAYAGNRTAVLMAIAGALGIEADLILARDAAATKPEVAAFRAYTRPLILFRMREADGARPVLLDAETEGIGFGGIAPTLERKDALLVSLNKASGASAIVSLPAPILDDRSTALAEVTFDNEGNLTASLEIRMGAPRSAQMRAILSGVENVNRKHFLEQLATRIFPGATDASGEIRNEFDLDNPLELVVRCRAERFANFSERTADLNQLAPALGLRKMYASIGWRHEPLFIDTPLIETATFRIRLPENMRFSVVPPDMAEQNAFGSYAVTFSSRSPNVVEVRRDFRVPVQVVEPDRFDAFSRFARRIDDAERQRLTVERMDQVSSTGMR